MFSGTVTAKIFPVLKRLITSADGALERPVVLLVMPIEEMPPRESLRAFSTAKDLRDHIHGRLRFRRLRILDWLLDYVIVWW